MTTVTLKIEATTTLDRWARPHGMTIDEPLDPMFWNTQTDAVIGSSGPPTFIYEAEIDLQRGIHTIEYGNGAYCKNAEFGSLGWCVSIAVDNVVVARGDCIGRDRHLVSQFFMGPKGRVSTVPFLKKSWFPKIKLLSRVKGAFKRQKSHRGRDGIRPR